MYNKAVEGVRRAFGTLERHLTSRTYLVGDKVTLADIVVVSSLVYAFKFLLDPAFRAPFPAVTRWFVTCVNQPQFKVRNHTRTHTETHTLTDTHTTTTTHARARFL